MTRRLRLAAAVLLILAGVLTPVASGADPGGSSDDASQAAPQCPQGYSYDSGSGDCEKHETRPAGKSCPATIDGHAVRVSGTDCVTTTVHTTLPTYTCDTANAGNPAVRFALVGDPPHCQRTVTRQVSEQRTVTDMVHFTETYTVRVPYTVKVKTVVTVQVPYTARVRVAPFTKTYMGMETYTYTVRVRYCAEWTVVVGASVCVRYRYRSEQRTGVRETLITEPVYHYREVTRYRPETRTVWRDETRYRTESRTRQVCCRPVTRTITVTRTVRDTQTAVPDATCTASGYSLNSSSRCERPAGTRLGSVTYRCTTGWSATSGDPSSCERTLTRDPTWACATGRTIDRSTSPPHCHPDAEDEDGDDDPDEDPDDEEKDEPDDEDDPPECTTALSTLSAGTVTRGGTWAAGCTSVHKSTDQVPYYAWRYTFTLDAAATLDLDATSAGDPHVYITDSDGTVVGSDDDSGADGRDSRIRGLTLQPDTYTVEVTTGSDRSTGSFTLTLKLTASPGAVTISGFKAAEGTPAVGEAAVTVSSGFTVSPATATCTATPTGAAVSPSSGAQRTASLSVAAATEATVTVTCTSGANSAKATAKFKANPAPVRISGLADATAPAGDADSATVSTEFDVTPADATCAATPAGATIAPATGAERTVSLEVDKGATVEVTVTCDHNGASHAARAKLTATPFGACTSPLGAFGAAGVTVRGTISAQGNCSSAFRRSRTGGTHWARRHVLVLAHPGWVTITLQSAPANSRPLDTYLVILKGDTADGTGAYVAHNDDQGRGHPTSRRDSRITRRFLPKGTYSIEATTYYRHGTRGQQTTGDYILHITTDHTPVPGSQPTQLRVRNGTTVTSTWAYQPPTAAVSTSSSFPDGITASLSAASGSAKLTATPSKIGQYAVVVTYANGPESVTKSTTIDSYCPTGQTELPGDCVTPLTALPHWHENVILTRPPKGYELAQFCNSIRMTAAESKVLTGESRAGTLWTCRYLVPSRRYISKTSDAIESVSEVLKGYGIRLVLDSEEFLEGCQSASSKYWQCDYAGSLIWTRVDFDGDESDYLWDAFIRGVLSPGRCATFLTLTWGTRLANPQTGAGAVVACARLFTWED
ncbi:MAG: hypothetical protein F4W98_13525 [Acidimicrobiales bacterium]|nr:hypothetical protein [Acidimicrobiales bacterium]